MVLHGTLWYFMGFHDIQIVTGSMCPRPFCCASHCGCSSPVRPKPLEISKNIFDWQSRLANLIFQKFCRFSRALDRALRVFSTHASFVSQHSSPWNLGFLGSIESQETWRIIMLCVRYIIWCSWWTKSYKPIDSSYWLILVNLPWITVIPSTPDVLHQAYHPNLLLNVLSLIRVFSSRWGFRCWWSFSSRWGSWKSLNHCHLVSCWIPGALRFHLFQLVFSQSVALLEQHNITLRHADICW